MAAVCVASPIRSIHDCTSTQPRIRRKWPTGLDKGVRLGHGGEDEEAGIWRSAQARYPMHTAIIQSRATRPPSRVCTTCFCSFLLPDPLVPSLPPHFFDIARGSPYSCRLLSNCYDRRSLTRPTGEQLRWSQTCYDRSDIPNSSSVLRPLLP